MPFRLESNYRARGDQGQEIAKLLKSVEGGARLCIAHLVWMEISKLHYLANYPSVAAEGLFALP